MHAFSPGVLGGREAGLYLTNQTLVIDYFTLQPIACHSLKLGRKQRSQKGSKKPKEMNYVILYPSTHKIDSCVFMFKLNDDIRAFNYRVNLIL